MTVTAAPGRPALLRRLEAMMDQQFWRWGCDVKHSSGNLLVDFGYHRVPPPADRPNCSSVYCLSPGERTRVMLRSFAVFYGDDGLGGLLLKRFDCTPYRTPAAELSVLPYQESDLPPLAQADGEGDGWPLLMAGLVEQILAYEGWVERRLGLGYLAETLAARHKRPSAPADAAEAVWRELLQELSGPS